MNSAFENAKEQIDDVVPYLKDYFPDFKKLKKAIDQIKKPQNFLKKKLSIKMDNGKVKSFWAYRSQHNDAKGPFKGGIRFHPNVCEDEVKALSTWMSIKCSTVGIPYGGGKGGISVDAKALSEGELERLSRKYAQFIGSHIGPWLDVPAPDVNTNERIMSWMLDEYEKKLGYHSQATFTGKPIALGGSLGRTEATGLGGFSVLNRYAKLKNLKPKNTTIAVQGFGNVGYWFSKFAAEAGYKVVALSDSTGGIYDPKGFNIIRMGELKKKHVSFKNISKKEGIKFITNEELLILDVDILAPAALENVLTEHNAPKVRAKTVIELANGPSTHRGQEILLEKGLDVLPDVLCSAGGVTVSYFEWAQNLNGYRWSQEEVNRKLEKIMHDSFEDIHNIAVEKNISYRKAAFTHSLKRIIKAMILRGRV